MMNISLTLSGNPSQNLSVPVGYSLSSLLAEQGFTPDQDKDVTLNGIPTTDYLQTLSANDSVFITRANKGSNL